MAEREITGKHVLIGFVAAFGVIVAVNLALAVSAVKTFPGLEVKNSYVASQTFDDRREAQEALGWTVSAHHKDGVLKLSIRDAAGRAVQAAQLAATVGRATHVKDDVTPEFRFDGVNYSAPVPLGDGNWNIRMRALAQDGTEFRQRVVLIKE
ncbi:FixH family protein [Roseovarius aestuariivivens]|uniref:FixH family protein n=1 Tax=Roseovarius aestuariivivens TaxID=1888910 RepID=UPI001AEC7043|nr:FixH family protein [Roseovarius aestuariivivens]